MTIVHKITLDLAQGQEMPQIQANQGEANSRQVEISLTENGEAWAIPEDAAAVVRYRAFGQENPDEGMGIYDTLSDGKAAWSVAENRVTITLVPQVLALAGQVQVDVVLTQGMRQLGTGSFMIYVNRAPVTGAEPQMPVYYHVFSLEQVNRELDTIYAWLQRLQTLAEDMVSRTSPSVAGDLIMNGKRVKMLPLPAEDTEAACKEYVDREIEIAIAKLKEEL